MRADGGVARVAAPNSGRGRGLVLGVFAVALALRALYLFDIRDNPFYDSPIIDAQYYRDLGWALSRGEGTGHAPFMMPPLYPLLLAALFRVTGPDLQGAHLLQIVLGATTAALTALLGLRLGGVGVGAVAGALAATNRAALYLEGDLLATPLAMCLDLLFLLLLLRFLERGRRRELVGAGIAAGLAALAVPTVLASLAVLAAWLLWRRRVGAAAVLVAATLLPILPVTVHNAHASGALVWISANGGINFYLGNNPEMRRTAALRPGPEYRRFNDLPLRAAGIVHPAQRDRWFYSQGLRFCAGQPLLALRQTGEKVLQLLHTHEGMRDFDRQYFAAHYSRFLRLPGWSFAWLLAAAVVGMVWARRGTAAETALLLFLASYALAIVAFFVTARYRAPLLPVLSVFAASGALWLVEVLWRRAWRPAAVALAVAAGVGTFSSLDGLGASGVDTVEAQYRVGTAYQQKGDCERALQCYAAVRRLQPDHALAAAHAAQCEQRAGRLQAAVDLYEGILQQHPDYVEPMVNLANLAWAHHDSLSAVHYFELAVATDPLFAQAHGYYGLFLLAQGAAPAAVRSLSRALELDPSWESLRLELARACVASGQSQRALRELDTVLEVMRPTATLELVRGEALQNLGRREEARAAWERGRRLDPTNAELQQRLRPGP